MDINDEEDGISIEYLEDMIQKMERMQSHTKELLTNLKELHAIKIAERNLISFITQTKKEA